MSGWKPQFKEWADIDPKEAAVVEAMRDATDILKWRVGPRPARWRVQRLAKALLDAQRAG